MAVISVNIVLAYFVNLGMDNNYINMLQILTNLSLLNVVLPTNLRAFYQAIISITNLNIIPSQYTNQIMNRISPNKNIDSSIQFAEMDIF